MSALRLYQHPDGSYIEFDQDSNWLVTYEDGGPATGIPIGPLGLIELGTQLIYLGKSLQAKLPA